LHCIIHSTAEKKLKNAKHLRGKTETNHRQSQTRGLHLQKKRNHITDRYAMLHKN